MVFASRWDAKRRMKGSPRPSRKLLLEGAHDADILHCLRGLEDYALEYCLPMKRGYNKAEVVEGTIFAQHGSTRTFGLVDMDHDYNGDELAYLFETLGEQHGVEVMEIRSVVRDTRPQCCLVHLLHSHANLLDASFRSQLLLELRDQGITTSASDLEQWWPIIERIAVFRTWLHHQKTLHPDGIPQSFVQASLETKAPKALDIIQWADLESDKRYVNSRSGFVHINDHCLEATLVNFLCMPYDQGRSWDNASPEFLRRTTRAFNRAFLHRLDREPIDARRLLPFLFDQNEG